jgi:hypothetical protein
MIVDSSAQNDLAISEVISRMFDGWSDPKLIIIIPWIGILVIPGRSIKVKSGHVFEYMFNLIGLFTIFLFFPATFSVNSIIFSFTIEKSVNFWSFISSKIA